MAHAMDAAVQVTCTTCTVSGGHSQQARRIGVKRSANTNSGPAERVTSSYVDLTGADR